MADLEEASLGGDVVLELQDVSRRFGAVRALTDVSFDCRAGEVHAVVGENGSGKSTLLGIASGFVAPDLGTVRIGGHPLRRRSPALARRLGLAMAYQDTSLVPAEPVKNNLYLAAPPDKRPPYRNRKKWARKVLADLDLDIELFPDLPAGLLSLAERQLLEVAKALVTDPLVLLLDEPTTALGLHQIEALHRTLLECKKRGVGVVYVSHRLPEVLEIADRVTVLRDGKNRGTFEAASTSEAELVELIVGRPLEAAFPPAESTSAERREVLVVDGLQGQAFGPVSLILEAGEIVGVAGAEGNGQPQLFDCLSGRQAPKAGRVVCDGKELTLISTHEAIKAGVMLLPGDRLRESLMPVLGVRANSTIQSLRRFSLAGLIRRRRERKLVSRAGRSAGDPHSLSGAAGGIPVRRQSAEGFGRPNVPSRSVGHPRLRAHPGGRRRLPVRHLSRASDPGERGAALLVKSSDPLELAGLCDRVLVMSRGQIIEEIPGDELDERRIVETVVRGPGLSRAGRSPLGVAMPKSPSERTT